MELIDVPDGDLFNSISLGLDTIKRTKNKVPKPVRLTNNLPFQSVRTIGTLSPILIPFAREGVSQFYSKLPGLCSGITYDYINGYIYINITSNSSLSNIPYIIIESIFEQPHLIETETNEGILTVNNISDDMLKSAPLFEYVIEPFEASVVFAKCTVVFHSGSFLFCFITFFQKFTYMMF